MGENLATTIACDGSVRLTDWALLRAHGADAAAFLQGQFSNDVTQVDEGHSQLNAYCTPKGRIIGLFRLFRRGDTFYLRLPLDTLEDRKSVV